MLVTVLSILQIALVVVLVILVLINLPGNGPLSGFSNQQHRKNSSIIHMKSSTDVLGKATAVFAGLFIINTLLLSGLCSKDIHKKSIVEKDLLEKKQENEPTSVPFEY